MIDNKNGFTLYEQLLVPDEIDYAMECYNTNNTINYNMMNVLSTSFLFI